MRVVIADDELLLREGLARLLAGIGIDVVGDGRNARGAAARRGAEPPDVAIVDIRMPPTRTDEGLVAARGDPASHFPAVGVLVLSHYLDLRYAMRLLESHPARVGYLLKERVSDRRRARRRARSDRRRRMRARPDDREPAHAAGAREPTRSAAHRARA